MNFGSQNIACGQFNEETHQRELFTVKIEGCGRPFKRIRFKITCEGMGLLKKIVRF